MRLKTALLCLSLLVPFSASAAIPSDCEEKLLAFEEADSEDKSIYDMCGFNDSKLVWDKWAPFASSRNAKKMLLEVCRRYPEHLYHEMYCLKAYRTGYAPAIAYTAAEFVKKGDMGKGIEEGTKALQSGQLSKTQEGELLEAFAVHYLKNNDERFKAYLQAASERRSALANHITAILLYDSPEKKEDAPTNANADPEEVLAWWRAILLGCPAAEENYGLYKLVNNKQISRETALELMKDKLYTCEASEFKEESEPIDEEMLDCRCKSAIDAETRAREKPYLLKETQEGRAILEDKSGQIYNVAVGDNLPAAGYVSEVHKTGVVLIYPNDRVILNLYRADACADFCAQYHIKENLSAEQMRERLTNQGPRIRPYRLTFSKGDCENITYYAHLLVDENLPYVGKKECLNEIEAQEAAMMPLLQELENASKIKQQGPAKKAVDPNEVLDRLNRMGGSFLEN